MDLSSQNNSWGGKPQPISVEVIKALEVKALEGSETASRILKTFQYNFELNNILDTSETHIYSDTEKLKIVDLLYALTTLELDHLSFTSDKSAEKLKSMVAELFKENCDDKGELDMKIRYCYCVLNLKRRILMNDQYPLEILKEGVRRYPDNCHYACIILTSLTSKGEYEEGMSYATEACKIFPKNEDLLYSRAVMLMSNESTPNCEMMQAYKDFLDSAPRDHRKVPEAYYNLSGVYLREFLHQPTEQNWQLMESTYERGLKSENDQLPCYIPYAETQGKAIVGGFLKNQHAIQKPSSGSGKGQSENCKCF